MFMMFILFNFNLFSCFFVTFFSVVHKCFCHKLKVLLFMFLLTSKVHQIKQKQQQKNERKSEWFATVQPLNNLLPDSGYISSHQNHNIFPVDWTQYSTVQYSTVCRNLDLNRNNCRHVVRNDTPQNPYSFLDIIFNQKRWSPSSFFFVSFLCVLLLWASCFAIVFNVFSSVFFLFMFCSSSDRNMQAINRSYTW